MMCINSTGFLQVRRGSWLASLSRSVICAVLGRPNNRTPYSLEAAFDPTNSIPIQDRLPYPQFDPGILTSFYSVLNAWTGSIAAARRA
ncbi:MAG: hypothetical protein J2P31_18850, partial [Blastocatellia bacterium]|nr:hypothetical protein [Blastocatellia bacterium]